MTYVTYNRRVCGRRREQTRRGAGHVCRRATPAGAGVFVQYFFSVRDAALRGHVHADFDAATPRARRQSRSRHVSVAAARHAVAQVARISCGRAGCMPPQMQTNIQHVCARYCISRDETVEPEPVWHAVMFFLTRCRNTIARRPARPRCF